MEHVGQDKESPGLGVESHLGTPGVWLDSSHVCLRQGLHCVRGGRSVGRIYSSPCDQFSSDPIRLSLVRLGLDEMDWTKMNLTKSRSTILATCAFEKACTVYEEAGQLGSLGRF